MGKKKKHGDKKDKKEKKRLLSGQGKKALKDQDQKKTKKKDKGRSKGKKHKNANKDEFVPPRAQTLMEDAQGPDKVRLLGRVLQYALANTLLDESVVYRWGKQVLAKEELQRLEIRATDDGDDSAPRGRPILLKPNIEGFDL